MRSQRGALVVVPALLLVLLGLGLGVLAVQSAMPRVSPAGVGGVVLGTVFAVSGVGMLRGRRAFWRMALIAVAAFLALVLVQMAIWWTQGASYQISVVAAAFFVVPPLAALLAMLYAIRGRFSASDTEAI